MYEFSEDEKQHAIKVINRLKANRMTEVEIIAVIDDFLEIMPKSRFQLHEMITAKYPIDFKKALNDNSVKIRGNARIIQDYLVDDLKLADKVTDDDYIGYGIELNEAGLKCKELGSYAKYKKYSSREKRWENIQKWANRYKWLLTFISGVLLAVLSFFLTYYLKVNSKQPDIRENQKIEAKHDTVIQQIFHHNKNSAESLKKIKHDTSRR